MNEFSLAVRRPRALAAAAAIDHAKIAGLKPESGVRVLADLSREELLREALYDPADPAGQGADALDDDRLREEVRWRRAAALREPAFAALARLLSQVSNDTFEALSRGDIDAEQLIEKANRFVSGQNGVKVLKLPDRVEDLERRLKNLESSAE